MPDSISSLTDRLAHLLAQAQQNVLREDYELLSVEALRQVMQERIVELEEDLRSLQVDLGGCDEKQLGSLSRKGQMERLRDLLQDYSDMVQGSLFRKSVEGARFFTEDLSSFSSQRRQDKMKLRQLVQDSPDGLSVKVGRKHFLFVVGPDGNPYFSSQAVDVQEVQQFSDTMGQLLSGEFKNNNVYV